jgi:flagellar biosynthetic protein FliR
MDILMERAHVTVGTILAFFRFSAFFIIAPFPGSVVPASIRIALSAGLAWAFGSGIAAYPQTSSLWGAIAVEIFLGLSMGFLLLIVFQAFVGAGEAAGTHMNVASAGYADPLGTTQITVMGQAFSYIALGIFALSDGPAMMCALLQQSLIIMPPGTFSHHPDALAIVTTGGSEIFRVAVHAAAPIIASVFAAHLVLMVLTRAIPNFNVFIEGPALTVATGTFGLWASVHTFAPMIEEQFTQQFDHIARWLFM